MKKLFLIPLLFCTTICRGQANVSADSLQKNLTTALKRLDRLMDSAKHPVKYARTLEEFLLATFPENSAEDGRWVYYKQQANLQRIEKPHITGILTGYDIYSVRLTNYLGWHVNHGTCLIFFDSLNAKLIFTEPLWYSGISEPLLKKFIGLPFNDRDTLLAFLTELHELMQIGSGYRFRQTSCSDSLVTYDLGYFKGDSYTTGGNGITSSVNYNEDGVWRKIRIEINNLSITRYISINPRINERETVE
ncbi:MAG: hypothetical protein QM791_13775 [Ferruginibacter sp.]